MARLDVWEKSDTLADDGYLDLQPDAGDEVVIHNLYFEDDVEVYKKDASVEFLIYSETGPDFLSNIAWHVTNTSYIRMKNVSGSADKDYSADGIKTKE